MFSQQNIPPNLNKLYLCVPSGIYEPTDITRDYHNLGWLYCLCLQHRRAEFLSSTKTIVQAQRLRWSRGSVLAVGTQVRGLVPGRSRRIFRAKKSSARLPSACKRSLNVMWKLAFRQNSRTFLAHSPTFRRWVLSRGETRGDSWWRKLERLTQIAQ